MGKIPQLSIITVFRNQKDEAEQILTALYEMKGLDFELIIYDNGSRDGTVEVIESLISHFNHDHTFFYINEDEEARGSVLNRAFGSISGQYLWMIDSLPEITQSMVKQGVDRMRTSSRIYAYLGKNNTPEDLSAALDAINTGKLPGDSVFIFNLKFMPVRERFLNPFLTHYHAFELCIRSGIGSFSGTDEVTDGLVMSRTHQPVKSDIRELLFSLKRSAGPEDNPIHESVAQALLRLTDAADDEKPDLNTMLAEARYYRREGKAGNALEMLNRIMELYPDRQEAKRIKVDILESQRRYVEAAELKHGLRRSESRLASKPVQPKIDDYEEPDHGKLEDSELTGEHTSAETAATDELLDDEAMPEQQNSRWTAETGGESHESDVDDDAEVLDGVEPDQEDVEGISVRDEVEDDADHDEAGAIRDMEDEVDYVDKDEVETENEAKKQAEIETEDTAFEDQTQSTGTGSVQGNDLPTEIRVSIIIPTAIHRKPLLEDCLAAIDTHIRHDTTELIIVDNASLDDTYDYLNQLEQDRFMNIRVIRNKLNAGFAASVNQGFKAAAGKYICVLHNDVTVEDDVTGKLAAILDKHADYAVIGPVTNRCMNPDQIRTRAASGPEVQETGMIDSFCMMFRASSHPEFDEQFGLAYAEDADICEHLRSQGWKVGIAPGVFADHLMGATTLAIGLDIHGPEYWINAARFNKKWSLETELPDLTDLDEVEQLALLGELMNTYRPEEELLAHAESLMSSETRTRILETKPDREQLTSLIRALILLDQRDILRHMEEKMDHFEPDPGLALRLIHYYFERNIYSRCMKYIEACGSNLPVTEKVFRLKIAIGEKEMDRAVLLLNELMSEAPVHPGIYKLAGDIHVIENNPDEAAEFYSLSNQIDPIRYGKSGKSETTFEPVI